MIAESAGATPYGIFLLADDFLKAANLANRPPMHGGPARLLSYHSAELFLKTYMRSAGETVAALRAHQHDLSGMVERARQLGLGLPPHILAQARRMARKNDYVRVRYVVVQDRSDIPVATVIRFATTIRASVIAALDMDEHGVPRKAHWLNDVLPVDYPARR